MQLIGGSGCQYLLVFFGKISQQNLNGRSYARLQYRTTIQRCGSSFGAPRSCIVIKPFWRRALNNAFPTRVSIMPIPQSSCAICDE
ncbi:hypothetical protein TorRG33x02_329800 [Trema orientale]|uniref:Uncharacterized protein n=1 Tax=Trema orientale TaxID=63057 RepID=A0A2P5B895_TREOI|nr:hypothetical protein TorRG33x02_329800 [Trema orientale]